MREILKKKITVVTSSRADFGLLHSTINLLEKNPKFDLTLLVTGTHLEEKFGRTIDDIKKENIQKIIELPIHLNSSNVMNVMSSMSEAFLRSGQYFEKDMPDLLILLGDRFEIFAFAQAAMFLKIPMAHIHGGELTEGAIDEVIRHSLTKLSHLHFTSNEVHRDRVIQLGEDPERVFNVGAPGLDYIKSLQFFSRKELSENYNIKIKEKLFLVTYHPVTLDLTESRRGIEELIFSMTKIQDATIIWTMPNADPDSDYIYNLLKQEESKNDDFYLYTNLGQKNYLSFLKNATAVVGNSSSGIIEAPFLKVPTINIGSRQGGRMQAASIINAEPQSKSIDQAIDLICSKSFQESLKNFKSLYGEGTAAEMILGILEKTDFTKLIIKKFYDLKK